MIKNCLLFLIILTLIVNPLILYSEENQDINLYEKGKEDGKKAVSFIDFPLWIVLGATSSCLLLIPNALFFTILLGSTPSPFFSSGVGCLIPLIITYLFDPCIPYNMLYTMLDTKKERLH